MLKNLLQLLLETFSETFFNTKKEWIKRSSALDTHSRTTYTIQPGGRFIAPSDGVVIWRLPSGTKKINMYSDQFTLHTTVDSCIYVLVSKGQNFGITDENASGESRQTELWFFPREVA